MKRVGFVVIALLAGCVLSPAASARPRVEVSVDTERARAAVEKRLRKAVARADRAARAAGVRLNVRTTAARRNDLDLAAKRRDAVRRAITRRLLAVDGARDRR